MTPEEIVKYTDNLLAEFYKDCQKQYNKEKRQADIILTNGDFSTLQNIMCEAITNNQNQILNKACEWLKEQNKMCVFELEMILGSNFIEKFSKAMEK